MQWVESLDMQFVILILVFVVSSLLFAALISWISTGRSPYRKRIEKMLEQQHKPGEKFQEQGFTVRWSKPLANLMLPEEDWKRSHIKSRLIMAGFRNPSAIYVYLASKLILTIIITLTFFIGLIMLPLIELERAHTIYILAAATIFGFFLPDIYLIHKKEERMLSMSENFPDALDLLVVCVEAGLSLDAAIQKVGNELMSTHSPLGDELGLVTLELRAGKGRNEAMRALGDRTGIDDIKSLTSILIQAENFGTSIASALREQAAEMRTVRIQRAREKAAKLPVKMTFPILLFIFPALFLVILGPAVISISEQILNR